MTELRDGITSLHGIHDFHFPGGVGRHPGLLDMYGTGGGLAEYRGALLASKGYTVLSLAFFAYEDLPEDLDVPYEYFEVCILIAEFQRKILMDG